MTQSRGSEGMEGLRGQTWKFDAIIMALSIDVF